MPRAFLITNKRYNSAVDYEDSIIYRDTSPERGVSTAEEPLHIADDESEGGAEYESLKPTSPKSPAHESNGPASPQKDEESSDQPISLTAVRTYPDTVRRNLNIQFSEVPVSSQSFVLPCHTLPLVTVIRQLIRQPATIPVITSTKLHPGQTHSPDANRFVISSAGISSVDSHICPECGKRYSTSSNLARHRQTHRSVTDKKARKCPHCDKVYVSMPAYSMHVRTHSQGCQCPYCGKCFSRPWLLQGHIRTHTGEKPFTCPVCHKAFADKSNLRAHIQTHSSSKPYACQRCGKAFALKSYLYKHEESSCMRLHRQDKVKDVMSLAIDLKPSPLTVANEAKMLTT